ncbi:NAD dependent epimerase/dehydratase [Colletotrichum tofieldiae]|uniref:NAD dependent epimerase/dehydratase n=1 Tax=Colletotrichum tofieldiae TaxID=708197 RepID=A0A166YEL8_9PEZI|nr:NAD dependent epimerase/dehydratase [Colletotrichum tofieldiae]GKT57041.1 NAD dependent epimerase/dehydratase [Colletotrichum tofieldiae]GKT78770.1 NAD dependent epimerase/dehydratase [Colletotrichum tofieldiae]
MTSNQTLLVTGANGYIGTHIVGLALERGYNVRATARSESSFANLRTLFLNASDRLSFAVVPDITKHESYEDALAGVTGIIHAASPFILNPKNNETDLLQPAINGSLAILEAARLYGPDVKRIVNVSSFASIVDMAQGYRPGYTYTEKDWNPMTYEEASKTDSGAAAYCASKALAEKAMWRWVGENQAATFTLANVCPPWVFGPYLGTPDLGRLSESMGLLWKLVDAKEVPPTDFGGYADVRDVARALIGAVETPAAGSERFLVGGGFDWQTAADLIREEVPEAKSRVPEGRPGYGKTEERYAVDGSKAERVLGLRYTPLNVTLRDSIKQLLDVEKASKSA